MVMNSLITNLNRNKFKHRFRILGRILTYTFLILLAITMIFPFVWMLSVSLKSQSLVLELPPKLIPRPIDFRAYIDIWSEIDILVGIKNSMIIAFFVITFGLISSSMAAFAFAKLKFFGRDQMFMVLLASIMIPFPVTMIPQYMLFDSIGWVDTLKPLIVPGLLGNVAVTFFIVQYLKTIPNEIIDSAKIDGCGYFGIYWRIILPLIKPAMAAQAIFMFMGIWNDLLGPVIYLSSPEKLTLQYVVATLNAFYSTANDYPMIMAGGIISMVPLIIVYLIFQRQIVDSLVISGMKG